MIKETLRIGRWVVDFLFCKGRYDIDGVLGCLYDAHAPWKVMADAEDLMRSCEHNCGFTYSNGYFKRAVVLIGPASSGDEFANTLSHEIHHLAVAIAKSIGYDLDGEAPAYLAGDTTMALIKTICEFGCDKCNYKNVQ